MKKLSVYVLCLSMAQLTYSQNFEMVKDINPAGESNISFLAKGTYSSAMQYITKIFFRADNGTAGEEPWVSDGTEAGTVMIMDINPSGSSYPSNFISVGLGLSQKVIFTATSPAYGQELWVTNGSLAGTSMLKDINPGTAGSYLINLKTYLFKHYFSANNGVNGQELWVTDGSSANTMMVKDINPGSGDANPSVLIPYNSRLYFAANNAISGGELWSTDGTEAGTMLVKDINPGVSDAFMPFFGHLFYGCVFNNQLYFTANDGTNGHELWVTDGSSSGTMLVKNINPSGDSYPQDYFVFGNKLFFTAVDGSGIKQVWFSDGTTAGTLPLTSNLTDDISPYGFTAMNDHFYFFASDLLYGGELWISDGTPQGTQMLKDINPSGSSYPGSCYFIEYNGYLYFTANTSNGEELFRTDGTEPGTTKMAPPIAPNSDPLNQSGAMVVYNNSLYFGASFTSHLKELWKLTDSTTAIQPFVHEQLSLYPNPATTLIYHPFKEERCVRIFNSIGVLVKTVYTKPAVPIDISDIPPGLYWVTDVENQLVVKVVKI